MEGLTLSAKTGTGSSADVSDLWPAASGGVTRGPEVPSNYQNQNAPSKRKETRAVADGDLSEKAGGPPEEDLPNEGSRRRLPEAASTSYSGARGLRPSVTT